MEFITPEEKLHLEAKLVALRAKRNEIIERIADARAKGDLSENADYHAAREDQGMNERSIREIEEKLKVASVADPSSVPDGVVFVGATVKLRDLDSGDEDLYRIVGDASLDLDAEYIEVSVNSPMGQSLMKATVGDVVRVDQPRGEKKFEIVEIV